ncbi:DUF1329 domain-containing protein [Pseudomonas sp. BN505]|uniref:DUF1329 domain-containing protein n=2 Tax=Pseudomonas TaxID=286 RepID=A0ABD6N134_9PSED|nr:DUF1329 domain-containing protein [Pseudomonas sp. BN607]MDH4842232.1 DUF1329 domain-containing protein [Pseudomonas sp. BN605]MDH4855087.1 DUF1329 domain-containing protein [Pseudomonas sp. BN505]NWL45086.1 DUF1329 domain-containing protein [Pseudomonas hunanensis]
MTMKLENCMRINKHKTSFRVLMAAGVLHSIFFNVSYADDVQSLGTTLTPLGAIKAGNAAGSIPAWTGNKAQCPANLPAGSLAWEPFADEKPVLSITAQNMAQYKDQLSLSVQTLLQTNPDYRVDVYPTHRTAVQPDWVYQYTKANATRATLTEGGKAVKGAYGGTPFPIPKSGGEAMWNHFLAWKGSATDAVSDLFVIDSNGTRSLSARIDASRVYPYYVQDGESKFDGTHWMLSRAQIKAPARRVGEATVGVFPMDYQNQLFGSWQYMPGQRRVRKLPNVQFDTPNFFVSGVANFDEAYGFFGSPEQYDWKLVGRKEMYIPYNTNKLLKAGPDSAIGAHFVKPEFVRWELHRVWQVEGKLKSGVRNSVASRTLYLDEDTWNVVLSDLWDTQNKHWRGGIVYSSISCDLPGIVPLPFENIDFQQKAFVLGEWGSEYHPREPRPRSFYSPEALVQGAQR